MDDRELFLDLAERLRVAHLRVGAMDLPGEEKLSISRRLLAITDASKHDLRRASERLDALLADVAERFPTLTDGA